MKLNGSIIGYDPGGNNANGFAIIEISNGHVISVLSETLFSAESVIKAIHEQKNIIGLGVDTLSCWCTGQSGWRPADKWLRIKYPEVRNSITSPNSLSGSMAINGMSVLIEASKSYSNISLSETHPKVLYYALSGKKYDYSENPIGMDSFLSDRLNLTISTKNDHEWDAIISAYALLQGLNEKWEKDLHSLPLEENSHLLTPCGATVYYWPNKE